MRLELPFPPSVNNLFLNPRGGAGPRPISARYRDWRKRATQSLWGQDLKFFDVPVKIRMTFEDAGRADLDNLCKGPIDFMVHHRLIPDDSRQWIRAIDMSWGAVKGVVIEVEPVFRSVPYFAKLSGCERER